MHVAHLSSTKIGYAFIELEDMHLKLGEFNGNTIDAVRQYRENTLIGECQIVVLSFLLTAETERRKYFM
jgi:hypothetical protein